MVAGKDGAWYARNNLTQHLLMALSQTPEDIPADVQALFRKYRSSGAAIKAGDEAALRRLLEYQLSTGKTKKELADEMSAALLLTAGTISPSMAQVMLDFGATLDQVKDGHDAAQVAVLGKNRDLALYFLEKNLVTVDHAERDGNSLLMLALQSSDFDLADQLFERGAAEDHKTLVMMGGQTALHLAAANVNFQAVVWLMEKGANPTLENTENRLACEMLPELDQESKDEGWDLDALFDGLEAYRFAYEAGQVETFEIPYRLREMAHMEKTPMSIGEAMAKQMAAAADAEAKAEEESVIPVKKKKLGF